MNEEPPKLDESPAAAPPEAVPPAQPTPKVEPKPPASGSRLSRLKHWYLTKKKWTIPASLVVVIAILAVIPWTRYQAAGLVLKKNFSIHVVDASSNSPVSGATVTVGTLQAQTDGSGKAVIRTAVGPHSFLVNKKYYQSRQITATVPILRQKSVPDVQLVATGRQVKVVVTDVITKKALSNASISVAGINAQTDKTGTALLVLPANLTKATATLSLAGYNDAKITILISNTSVKENDFTLTPSGKIYFLSKRTGTLNVMKSDLDGANVQVVLAGTGTEQVASSAISQSADGKYIALLTKRSNADAQPQLYIISASDDKLLTIDTGNTVFLLQGWLGDKLIYTAQRNDIPAYTVGANKLKSYDAVSGKTVTLDQSSATGDSTASAFEYFATVTLARNTVIYAKSWSTSSAGGDTTGLIADKNNTLNTIGPDGAGLKNIASYPAGDSVQYIQHSANALYIWQQAAAGDKFFDYVVGATPKSVALTSDQFYSASSGSYFTSASGAQVLWSERRDGKDTVLVADAQASNSAVAASLSGYNAYGWYTDQYVLLSKNNSELYIIGSGGGTPLKITDYQSTGLM